VAQVRFPMKQLDETFFVSGEKIADRAGEGMLIETDGLYGTRQPPMEPQPGEEGATPNGMKRDEPVMTPGGPQPVQPPQPGTP